jgi:hypothetical protein
MDCAERRGVFQNFTDGRLYRLVLTESQSSHALPGASGGRASDRYGSADSGNQLVLGRSSPLKLRKRGQPSDEAEPKGLARSTPLVETTRLVDTPGDMMRKSKKRKRPVACRNARGISGSGHLQRSGANAADLQASIGRPTRARWWETRHLQRSAPTLRFSPANRLHRQQPDREARPLSHWPLPPPVAVCAMAGGGGYRTP